MSIKVPEEMPESIDELILELKKSKSQKDCLKKVYDILAVKYHGNRIRTYTRLFQIFNNDLDAIWSKSGFLHCTKLNDLMIFLLLKSAFFKQEDIKKKWTLIWFISPHQYLKVKVDGYWINVDIWSKMYGIEFGDYAHGFH